MQKLQPLQDRLQELLSASSFIIPAEVQSVILSAVAEESQKHENLENHLLNDRKQFLFLLSNIYPAHLRRQGELIYVCIHSPAGQMSWEIRGEDLESFNHLAYDEGNDWDGHSVEEKYQRLQALAKLPQG